jgi:predicted amidohydrolase
MIGVAVGYDVEFPLVVRAMAEAGAAIILAPSFTATAHGFHRVRIAAAARALENQCFVVRAAIVGPSPLPAAFARATGTAGIHAPPDGPFPDDGVLAEGRPGDSGWVRAHLDLDALDGVRAAGDTLNHAHWAEQGILTAPPAEVVDLT